MRYGRPELVKALAELSAAKVEKIIVLPLYPQYSATTTATTLDAIARQLMTWRDIPSLSFVRSYYDLPEYIEGLAAHIRQFWQEHGMADKLLLSFHGLPQRYVDKGDPYYQECMATASQLAQLLKLSAQQWQVVFQSRLGVEKWLQPYLDHTLRSLPSAGVKSVQVICPGFAVDCLETLEEVAQMNRELFLHAGGEKYQYIPALNSSDAQIRILTALINIK
jgi:ferrochelatase